MARLCLSVLAAATMTGCFSAPPQIISLEPNRGSSSVVADQPITVVFDHAIDHASLPGRFHISPSLANCDLDKAYTVDAAAPCQIQWLSDRPGFTFDHRGAIFAPNTIYSFTLDAGVKDTDGSANPLDHSWSITSEAAPQIVAATPDLGATGVAVDAPLAVEFDRPMSVAATAAAITLAPPVASLTVLRNTVDNNRFVILPGRLLRANTSYRMTISAAAVDDYGQPLAQGKTIAFTTGGLSPTRHLVALVAHQTGAGSEVLLLAPRPAQPGEPAAATTVLDLGPNSGMDLSTPALSPSGRQLAVVSGDGSSATPLLRVVDVATGDDAFDIKGGSLPSWSAHGDLAYRLGPEIEVRQADGTTAALPVGDPLLTPAVWSPGGDLLALSVGQSTDRAHIDLASPAAGARFPLPGVIGVASAPVISPDGSELAFRREPSTPADVGGIWVFNLGGSALPQRIAALGTPLGFADSTTLIIATTATDGSPTLARLALGGGGPVALTGGPGPESVAATRVSADGRQIVYLAAGGGGGTQAWIENGDGSGALALTDLTVGQRVLAVDLSP